ncbi:MAG: hypothetical protein ACKV19_09680, partial [Verrucomicrobiales bacterium]
GFDSIATARPVQVTDIVRNPGNGHVTLTFLSAVGSFYNIEATTDFISWTTLNDNFPGTAIKSDFTDTTYASNENTPPSKPRVFYRVTAK